jgi:hypothetical protein
MRKWRFDDFEKKEMKQANASNSKNHSRIQTSGEREKEEPKYLWTHGMLYTHIVIKYFLT